MSKNKQETWLCSRAEAATAHGRCALWPWRCWFAGVGPGAKAAKPAIDKAALERALADLPKWDWGQAREPLNVIDNAVVASYGDADARKDLEARLCPC